MTDFKEIKNKDQFNLSFVDYITKLSIFVFIVFTLLYLVLFSMNAFFDGLVNKKLPLWSLLIVLIISGVVSLFSNIKIKE